MKGNILVFIFYTRSLGLKRRVSNYGIEHIIGIPGIDKTGLPDAGLRVKDTCDPRGHAIHFKP